MVEETLANWAALPAEGRVLVGVMAALFGVLFLCLAKIITMIVAELTGGS